MYPHRVEARQTRRGFELDSGESACRGCLNRGCVSSFGIRIRELSEEGAKGRRTDGVVPRVYDSVDLVELGRG